jgi:hypothetical protein
MIVNIYDVGHGFCAYVRDEVSGANLLFDCGYNEGTGFHPVDEVLAYGPIGGLVIQNCDEDHLDGLPHLLSVAGPLPVSVLFSNPTLDARTLLSLKDRPYGDGLLALLGLKRAYSTATRIPSSPTPIISASSRSVTAPNIPCSSPEILSAPAGSCSC